MTEEQFKDKCARILRDNITFSPQGQNYIITGALDAIWKLHIEQKLNKHGVSGKRPTVEDFFRQSYPESSKWDKFDFEMVRFDAGSLMDFAERYASQAACASGAVGTVAEGREFNLAYCDRCIQMTNHKKGKCCKCDARKSSGGQP